MHKVLICGLEKSVREALLLLLEDQHDEVHTTDDAYCALETIEALQPDIVVMNIRMPHVDGLEFLRQVQQFQPDAEVIVIAGQNDLDLAIEALNLGASDFVLAPAAEKALQVALRRARERIWMRRRLQEAVEEIQKRHDFEHKLIQTSMDGIIANDRKGSIIVFNDGATRIYGYSREEAITSLHVTALYPEGEAHRIKKTIYGSEYGGPGRLINYETLATTKDGRLVPILLSATLIYEGDQEVATVGYFKDLSEIRAIFSMVAKRE